MTRSWTVGDVTVSTVVESVAVLGTEELFPGTHRSSIAANREWLSPWSIDADDNLILTVQSLLIDADGTKIVVDTCVGAAGDIQAEHRYVRSLTEVGFAPASVDYVVCTHLHLDHVGWNTRRDGESWIPTFERARYVFAREAVDAWNEHDPFEELSHGDVRTIQPLLDHGVVDLVPTDHQLTPSVRFISTPGHARGNISLVIESGGARALITGDSTHHPVQWIETGFGQMSDVDVETATLTRQRIIRDFADTGALIIGSHYPDPTAGYLISTSEGVRFAPLA